MQYPRHLLQSSSWAKFRSLFGTKVVKIGKSQFTVHPIPFLPLRVGYMPRPFPNEIDWQALERAAKQERCVYVKIEPNSETFTKPLEYLVRRGKRMFAYATYIINLQKSEEELLTAMHPKTRYNIGLAKRKGVEIKIGRTETMLKEFLALFHETSSRNRFFNHPDSYYTTLFSVFRSSGDGEIITGYYQGKPLASIMVFFYNKTMFYPYGGSTLLHKDKMAFYLVMWNAILLGKSRGCHYFDMWNCLLPEQESNQHPWYGFHRFKKGFNGQLLRFCGAYDFIVEPTLYPALLLLDNMRWAILHTFAVLKKVTNR